MCVSGRMHAYPFLFCFMNGEHFDLLHHVINVGEGEVQRAAVEGTRAWGKG